MFELVSTFPASFWVVIATLISGTVWSIKCLRQGTGIPMLVVLGTVTFWYVGDAFYNDYTDLYVQQFSSSVLENAWWQVAWFLITFLFFVPLVHRRFNARYLGRTSGVIHMFKHGVGQSAFQAQLNRLFHGCVLIWLAVSVVAAIRLKGYILYYFFPFWGFKAEPWGRGQFGTGFDSLLTVAIYLQLLVAAMFGVVTALATNRRVRILALVCCLLTWPYFILDRTRNTILAVVMPGILGWCILRLRGSLLKKGMALALCFVVINGWMKFVIANRGDMSIAAALMEKGLSVGSTEKVRHQGLNMYEELCWISTFIDRGSYSPNWGARYFADLVNPIPRVLWPGKPAIGFDYAILRGQRLADNGIGVTATISTGLIGQGVVNFGRFLGPVAAALIMSFCVAILARLDFTAQAVGRLPLYAIGLFVTFNVGRDFCFLALYPFVFGALMVWYFDRHNPQPNRVPTRSMKVRRRPVLGSKAGLTGGRHAQTLKGTAGNRISNVR